ncbi:J domain-containing protein [Paraglaciecola marina]|uniref:J domain-containing protein n=1 Tax=Paraglaciecola marina TaxID=2500157 RepID=UPI00105DE883|nr:J domain-containing protein [Paraglaciecola marina]
MKITDAANLLGLSGHVTKQDIKKAYRAAALKYHPDKNPAGAEMMKIINAAFDVLKEFSGEIPTEDRQSETTQNYSEALSAALNIIIDLEGLALEICGAWLWVSGETFKHKTLLKEAGFKFASKKKSWYFRPENWKSASRGSYSMDEIRDTYGSAKPVKPSRRSLTSDNA